MRFRVAHKVATYLMVAFSVIAVSAGGGIAPPIALFGLVGLLLSWWWEPPLIRYERWNWMWTAATVMAFLYSAFGAMATGDFIGVGGQFLLWLTVVKAFNRRSTRDLMQLYLLSFLLLVAGSVLNIDLTYGACFLGFVISTTWALSLWLLRREAEVHAFGQLPSGPARPATPFVVPALETRGVVNGRYFWGTGLLSIAVFAGSAATFLALPRFGVGYWARDQAGTPVTGFSDGVKLGGHGLLRSDSTVVMRVELAPPDDNRQVAEHLHWRGIAFDRYRNGEWFRSQNAPRTNAANDEPRPGTLRRVMFYDRHHRAEAMVQAFGGHSIEQDIWLEGIDNDFMFAASMPRVVEVPARANMPTQFERNDELRWPHGGSTIHYKAWSRIDAPDPAVLRTLKRDMLEPSYEVYLEVPPEITQRTRDLALQITSGYDNDFDKATAIVTWLQSNLTYTLELEEPGEREPIDMFLFDRKKGHCEYFASAFAIMARVAGIPTRNVNGFLGGEWNEFDGYLAVRAGDAHSWSEVYFPGYGWVTFDPTPAAAVDPATHRSTGWRAKLRRWLDTLRFQWTKWVIDYDLQRQLSVFKGVGRAFKAAARQVAAVVRGIGHVARANLVPLAGAAALLAIVIALAVRRRRARPDGRARTSPAALAYRRAIAGLGKIGIRPPPSHTPREVAARLRATGHAAGGGFTRLVDLYYAEVWGGQPAPEAELRAAVSGIDAAITAERQARRS